MTNMGLAGGARRVNQRLSAQSRAAFRSLPALPFCPLCRHRSLFETHSPALRLGWLFDDNGCPQETADGFFGIDHSRIIDVILVAFLNAYAVAGVEDVNSAIFAGHGFGKNALVAFACHRSVCLGTYVAEIDGALDGIHKHGAARCIVPVI